MGAGEGHGVMSECVCIHCVRMSLCALFVCVSFGLERMSSMNKTKPTSILFACYF